MKPGSLAPVRVVYVTTFIPGPGSRPRRVGSSSLWIESSNDDSRPCIVPLQSNLPSELFCKYGALDHKLINDAGLKKPRPPAGTAWSSIAIWSPLPEGKLTRCL